MIQHPNYTTITTQAEGYLSSGFWVLQRTAQGLAFATFPSATALLAWYEDACVSEGEEGRTFSDCILAWSQPFHELEIIADGEAENEAEERALVVSQ